MKNTNYFGRICRFLGRVNLFIGFILCIGVGTVLVINPMVDNKKSVTDIISETTPSEPISSGISATFSGHFVNNQIIGWFITGAILAALIIALYYLAQKYNAVIRKIIANTAKKLKIPIHFVELSLTLIVWSALLTMLLYAFPYATTFLIFPFIFNELFFLFGWISYGMVEYKI